MPLESSACRGCGKPICWGVTADGKRIPLDPRPPVYRIVNDAGGNEVVERDKNAMVSHFATCPKANEFSGGRKA